MMLRKEEQGMLDGEQGPGIQKAMELLVALGKIYNAESMVEIKSAQVAGVSYKNLGKAGLEFLQDWADKGARVRVPTTLNPAGIDIENWKKLGISEDFAKKQIRVIEAYKRMGIKASCTCVPYLAGNLPGFREHIAWSESSAVSYANSVIGARTNREGGPSALAAAITGLTPEYGLHLDENRKANLLVDVKCEMESVADFGALGYMVGKEKGNSIPYFKGIKAESDHLKALGAAMAASGAVALYHVEGITPETELGTTLPKPVEQLTIENLDEGYHALNSDVEEIDLVTIGCPHASLNELKIISQLLNGKKVKSELWITTSRKIIELNKETGILQKIEGSGAKVIADTCMVVSPIEELGFKNIATNSGKAAFYLPSHCKAKVRFGSLEKCIQAAITGSWPS